MSAIFVLCQGRTGGTILADVLARMADGLLLIEPLHPHLGRVIREDPVATHAKLGHRVRKHPFADYQEYDFRYLMNRRGFERIAYLVRDAPRTPVLKVCRLWGKIGELRRYHPEARFVHLWRDAQSQHESMRRAGIPHGYFGEPGETPLDAWRRALDEGRAHADVSISYAGLLAKPAENLSILEALLRLPPGSGAQWADLVTSAA